MLSLFKKDTAASLQARRDRLRNEELPAQEAACRTAKRAEAEGGNPNDFAAAYAHLKEIEQAIEELERFSIPDALEREAADELAARTEEEKRLAEAAAAARQTNYNGAVKLHAAYRKALAPVSDAAGVIAKALADAIKTSESLDLKRPDDRQLPHDGWVDLVAEASRFIAGELARAGCNVDLQLPAPGDVPERSPEAVLKDITARLAEYDRRIIRDGERAPVRQAIRDVPPAPVPYRPARSEDRPVYGFPTLGAARREIQGWVTIEHPAQGTPPIAEPEPVPAQAEIEQAEPVPATADPWAFDAEMVAASRALHFGPATNDSEY